MDSRTKYRVYALLSNKSEEMYVCIFTTAAESAHFS